MIGPAQKAPSSSAPPAPAPQSQARSYSAGQVGQILAVAAAVVLLLDADGLLTWVRRMPVSQSQSAWMAVVEPLQSALDAAGLTRPRRALMKAADAVAGSLGGGGDPLFAEAWGLVELAPNLDALKSDPPDVLRVPDPMAPEPVDPKPPQAVAQRPTVLLVGDSLFAGNLAAAIGKTFAREHEARVVSAYQTATGLSRTDVFDWGKVVSPLMERERPRWVVCSFGANDAQAIREGSKLLAFGDPDWEALYRQRVRTMMREVASSGARVLWLGLPPMRDELFDRRARHLNDLFKREANEISGVDYLDLSKLFAGPDGGYASFLNDGRRLTRMRMEDGIHYSAAGAHALAQRIHGWAMESRARGEVAPQ